MEPLDDRDLSELLSQLRLDDRDLDELLSQLKLDDKALDELLSQIKPDNIPNDPTGKYLDVPEQDDHTDLANDAGEADGAVWTRSDDETAKSYAAFCLYRDLGSGRSLDAAFAQAKGCQKGVKRVSGFWQRWSRDNAWKNRAEAYDAHLELLARREREAAFMKDLEAMRQRQKTLSLATFSAAIGLLQKAKARLEALDAADIDPGKLPAYFRAAAAVAEMATNAEAVALGLHELMSLLDAPRDAGEVA